MSFPYAISTELQNAIQNNQFLVALSVGLTTVLLGSKFYISQTRRTKKIIPKDERVLLIGATSGVGRKIASLYAKRGAKVCIVGRRENLVEEVRSECAQDSNAAKVIGVVGDMTNAEDMVRVRGELQKAFGGLDTIHICAGVSSLRPLLDVAGSPRGEKETSAEGVANTAKIAQKAIDGNFTGPLVVATTFIPFLQSTSSAPAINLISSVAALIPAPTRSLYCSSKAASLMLFRALAIEHPKVKFGFICPGTIEGNFRASAVDGGDVREVLEGALKSEEVAKRCLTMVDHAEGMVIIPFKYHLGLWLSLLVPSFTTWRARVKYNFA